MRQIYKGEGPFSDLEEGVVAKALKVKEGKDWPEMAKIKTKDYLVNEENRYPWLTEEEAAQNIESKQKALFDKMGQQWFAPSIQPEEAIDQDAYKKLFSPVSKKQAEEGLYPEDLPVMEISKARMEKFLKGLDDKFYANAEEAGSFPKKGQMLLRSPGVEDQIAVIKDSVVMKREDLEKTIFGSDLPKKLGDEILTLNVRKAPPRYPEAVPISKEAGFMFPNEAKPGDVGRFVLHRHEAHRAGLHHDLRVEIGKQLQSFAVPQLVPDVKGQQRLAIGPTAHHGMDYYQKGTYDIPRPFYGAGTMRTAEVGAAVLESMKGDHVTMRLKGVRGMADGTYSFIKYDPKGEKPRQQQWLLQKIRPLEERDPERFQQIYTEGIKAKEQKILDKLSKKYEDSLDATQGFSPGIEIDDSLNMAGGVRGEVQSKDR